VRAGGNKEPRYVIPPINYSSVYS